MLHAFSDSLDFARALARALGRGCAEIGSHAFPDGETRVQVQPDPGPDAIVVRSFDHPNPKLIEALFAADALRRCGAERVTLVAPYLPYMRQDRVFQPGEALSQRVVGEQLGRAFDRIVAVEPHLHRIRSLDEVFPTEVHAVGAAPALAGWVRALGGRPVVVGPDIESKPWVEAVAREADLAWLVARKERFGDEDVRVAFDGQAEARHAVLIDDIASSGSTLAAAALELRAAGVARIDAAVVHALFAAGARERMREARIERVVSCDTISHETNEISVVPLVADALREE